MLPIDPRAKEELEQTEARVGEIRRRFEKSEWSDNIERHFLQEELIALERRCRELRDYLDPAKRQRDAQKRIRQTMHRLHH